MVGINTKTMFTGGKTTLLGISKRGDKYIRKNLIHRCRSVVNHSKAKDDNQSRWINKKLPVKGFNKTAVTVANKTARAIGVELARKEEYKKTL